MFILLSRQVNFSFMSQSFTKVLIQDRVYCKKFGGRSSKRRNAFVILVFHSTLASGGSRGGQIGATALPSACGAPLNGAFAINATFLVPLEVETAIKNTLN